MGTFRRVIAGLLALVLLALPGAAIRHAPAAVLVRQQVAAHCATHGHAATLVHPMPMHAAAPAHDHGPPCDGPGDRSGLACCMSARCAAGFEGLPPISVGPLPSPGAVVRYAAPARGTPGLEVPPSLPPPRHAA